MDQIKRSNVRGMGVFFKFFDLQKKNSDSNHDNSNNSNGK